MNTRHLEEFLVFAQNPNWTVASEQLFVTRPTLVEHVRELEEELGCKLVESDHRQVSLTLAGRRFVQTAHDLLASWESTRKEYSALADNLLTVTVAASNLPWLETLLHKARTSIRERHPFKRIEIAVVNGTFTSVEALLEGKSDIVVAGYKTYLPDGSVPVLPEGTCGFPLRTEEIKLLMMFRNPLFAAERIRVCDLDGCTVVLPPDIYRSWVRDDVPARFAALGAHIDLRSGPFSDHTEYFAHDFGKAFGIVPTSLVPRFGIDTREEFRAFSLEDMRLETRFYAVFSKEYVATENGGLLYDEMRRLAGEKG